MNRVVPKVAWAGLCGLFALLACRLLAAGEKSSDAKGAEFFADKIRPILADNCFQCHSHKAAKIKGELLLDSREAALKGGATGPVIVPGDPEKSLLIKAVSYTDPELQMPPKNKKLPDEKIALLRQWVKLGAPYAADAAKPQTPNAKSQKDWWSFQPVREPPVPKVQDKGWCRNDIDRFIYQKLATEKLSPAPAADRRALIRRVTFDLWGLPPTPSEVEAFVADKSADAYEKLVDRLLASPRYGERWARHWLDLVRYADSDGYRIDDFRPDGVALSRLRRSTLVQQTTSLTTEFVRRTDSPATRLDAAHDPDATDLRPATCVTGFTNTTTVTWLQQWNGPSSMTSPTPRATCSWAWGCSCARCHDHKFDPILRRRIITACRRSSRRFLPRDRRADVATDAAARRLPREAREVGGR